VLADIHGNLPALESVLADLAPLQVDQIVVAGDLIHWGPFSSAVVQRVISSGWPVIRGNHEYYLLDYGTPHAPAAWSDTNQWRALIWLQTQVTAEQRRHIAVWPDTIRLYVPDAPPLRLLHGSPRSNRDGVFASDSDASIAERFAGVEETTIITAHTHLPLERWVDRWHLINPGSVGAPFLGYHEASYALLDGDAHGWRAIFRRVPVDPTPILLEFERQATAAAWGVLGPLLVREFETAVMRIGSFLRWRETLHPGTGATQELVTTFLATEPWTYIPAPYREARLARDQATMTD
jgi:predicted phosphodiesterase